MPNTVLSDSASGFCRAFSAAMHASCNLEYAFGHGPPEHVTVSLVVTCRVPYHASRETSDGSFFGLKKSSSLLN
jgi:hypothetical protein